MNIQEYIRQHQLTEIASSGVNPPAAPHHLTNGFENAARATIYTNTNRTIWVAVSQDSQRFALITPKIERFTGFSSEHYPTLNTAGL